MDQLEEDLETLQDTVEKMEEEHDKMEEEKKSLTKEKVPTLDWDSFHLWTYQLFAPFVHSWPQKQEFAFVKLYGGKSVQFEGTTCATHNIQLCTMGGALKHKQPFGNG